MQRAQRRITKYTRSYVIISRKGRKGESQRAQSKYKKELRVLPCKGRKGESQSILEVMLLFHAKNAKKYRKGRKVSTKKS